MSTFWKLVKVTMSLCFQFMVLDEVEVLCIILFSHFLRSWRYYEYRYHCVFIVFEALRVYRMQPPLVRPDSNDHTTLHVGCKLLEIAGIRCSWCLEENPIENLQSIQEQTRL